jgi:hypothetical protein
MSATGLSTQDVESIRGTLAAGRRPKVLFTDAAGQIAGQVGQVVQLTDPAAGDDYLVVRFGRDELPFSPTDLAIPPRNSARKSTARPAARSAPEFMPPVPAPREEKKTMTSAILDTPPPPSTKPSPAKAGTAKVEAAPTATPVPAGPEGEVAKPAPRKATKAAKPKAPAGLTVTLAYAEGDWTVAAQQGSKVLAKPYLIKPTEALRMVALLDVPGVQEAVEQIVSAERTEARQHALRLRAELADIEAKLAELGDAE